MIDLQGIAHCGVDTAFELCAQIVVSGDIVQPAQGYDATTGDKTGSETTYPIDEIILIDYELSRVDGQIIRDLDKMALLRVSEISVAVTDQMILRLSGGDEWDILKVIKDPSNTLYELQCRRP